MLILNCIDNLFLIVIKWRNVIANDYLFPICKDQLRAENSLAISVKSKSNKRGLLFLNQEIGNYGKITQPTFMLVEGDELTVFRPTCHSTLNREDPHLVKIIMIEKGVRLMLSYMRLILIFQTKTENIFK